MTFEAKAERIKKQLGSLDAVIKSLGINQRQMAQLLLVDPSTMNRWIKNQEQVPPHIWRSIEWYMTLEQKTPGLSAEHFIGKSKDDINQVISSNYKAIQSQLAEEIDQVKKQGRDGLGDLEERLKNAQEEVSRLKIDLKKSQNQFKINLNLTLLLTGFIILFFVFKLI